MGGWWPPSPWCWFGRPRWPPRWVGADLTRRELFAAAWFGPKGFASMVYGLLVLHSGIPNAVEVYELVVVCIALSIVAHSSTDVPVARLFDVEDIAGVPDRDG